MSLVVGPLIDFKYDRRAFYGVCFIHLVYTTAANSTRYRWSQVGRDLKLLYYETDGKNMIVLSLVAIFNIQAF